MCRDVVGRAAELFVDVSTSVGEAHNAGTPIGRISDDFDISLGTERLEFATNEGGL